MKNPALSTKALKANYNENRNKFNSGIWFNKVLNGKIRKEKVGGFQLNLKLNDFSNPEFPEDKYLTKWEMKDGPNNTLGSGNGVYILPLKGKAVPDTLHISLCKIEKDMNTSTVSQFTLVRKR